MGAVGGLLGLNGGAGGTGFSAPSSTTILNPSTVNQANTAYGGVQNSLASQQALLNALQGQNGLGNQASVYNQLQGIANGQGPNPAQTMLNQATAQNTANQAALMASQRGTSANAGLIARQAAQQGAANQQNAAGQGATMQAQQSLQALGQMGNLATTQAGQQINQTNANTQAQQAEQGNILNGIAQQNNANVGMQSNMNNANASLANTTMQGTQNVIGSLMNGGGAASAIGSMFAEGGKVSKASKEKFASGGPVSFVGRFLSSAQSPSPISPEMMNPYAPPNATAASFNQKSNSTPAAPAPTPLPGTLQANTENSITDLPLNGPGSQMPIMEPFARGGKVSALVSPGEVYLNPQDVKKVKTGKDPIKTGRKIPGTPKYPGNDYRNDVVPAKLDSGGIIIPNKILQSKNPHASASKFVAEILAAQGRKKRK